MIFISFIFSLVLFIIGMHYMTNLFIYCTKNIRTYSDYLICIRTGAIIVLLWFALFAYTVFLIGKS